ncbi:hypothetical protein M5362_29290 [Streptomyces sp. Je 1-79]|uniref:hypothetical protein n=1 Tax=Streptomyces sp. Je 1-79 TaxID=2943847 RepID=UPI0021A84835|nr:hypothetical protein [Streptomyces sp. Je 1-79]MCT4357208.1 hypothetical protein [Streptomyces sp. Je 1-79]
MYGVSGTGSVPGEEMGARAARTRALGVLRVRGRALGVAVLPAAAAVILYAGGVTGHMTGAGWDTARGLTTALAVVVLLAAAAVALVIARSRPAVTPTVELAERSAPDLYRMVRDLADRLGVPAPSAIALTPDCDSWLEDRTHPAHGPGRTPGLRRSTDAPVLVIGSPFLWWMRVGELRAVLAPVVAGTAPAAHPDIAAARRFVQGLDAAVAAPRTPGLGPVGRLGAHAIGRVARVLLLLCRGHAAEMERGVAVAGSERAQAVDYGIRIVAQEQVGLAYAGWDRLLTRVALPAWRMGRWPSSLDVGVVAALTELSRRDRLAKGFTTRLGERPACDLLEEPGAVDEAASLLAARLFHGGPAEVGPDWSPVDWSQYPEEVVDRKWRSDAARLHQVLDELGVLPAGPTVRPGPGAGRAGGPAEGPTLTRVMTHLSTHPAPDPAPATPELREPVAADREAPEPAPATPELSGTPEPVPAGPQAPDDLAAGPQAPDSLDGLVDLSDLAELDVLELPASNPAADTLAAALTARVAREEAAAPAAPAPTPHAAPEALGGDSLPLFPLAPPRTGRDLLADHVTAMVCCAAVDTAGAAPGLDWLDGPALLVGGVRNTDLAARVLALVEDGDPEPLSAWLTETGVRPEKPVRLV